MALPLFAKDPLAVGSAAPLLTVTTHTGESLDLAKVYAEGPTLVYFYPKADTPGCTAQACNLRDNFAELQAAGVTVLGVSTDKVETQADFQEKYELPFPLIADHDKALGKAFGVGNFMGAFYSRQTFLVVDGKVVWRDLNAKPATQTQDALQALQSAQAG